MKADHYLNRARFFIPEGIKVGFVISLCLSLLYAMFIFIIFQLSMPGDIPEISSITLDYSLGAVWIISLIGFVLFIAGVVPAIVVGSLGGGIIGFVLALFEKKLSRVWSGAIGFVIGSLLILIANIPPWWIASQSFYINISFLDYFLAPIILTSRAADVAMVYLFYFPYFIPNILGIMISPYIGWRINKAGSPELVAYDPSL